MDPRTVDFEEFLTLTLHYFGSYRAPELTEISRDCMILTDHYLT